MTHYKEKDLEAFIEEYLLSHSYIKREDRDYDKSFCLDSELLYGFILSTQSKALDELSRRGINKTTLPTPSLSSVSSITAQETITP